MTSVAPIHVLPLGAAGDHRPTESCGCGPIASLRDLATGARVYRHRGPQPQPPARCRDPLGHAGDHRWYPAGAERRVFRCGRCDRAYGSEPL
jgi:hypothetical protein